MLSIIAIIPKVVAKGSIVAESRNPTPAELDNAASGIVLNSAGGTVA